MTDPRLDRRPEFDPRSRQFPIRALLGVVPPPIRSYTWSVPVALDQGSEGACVGFSWAQEVAARPAAHPAVNDTFALDLYRRARQLDEWPGEDYDGTSVLAGAKAVSERGYMAEYRWGFSLDDLLLAVGYKGPAVLGLNWYTGMMKPESDGRIRPTGQIEGGHAILMPRLTSATLAIVARRRRAYLYQSWGLFWGPEGPWCWLSWDDLERLLHEQGESCIPIVRRVVV
jgi:hypothetical protein